MRLFNFKTIIMSTALCTAFTFQAFAGWEYNNNYELVYRQDNGDIAKNSWIRISNTNSTANTWYYAKGNGELVKSDWKKIGDNWYFFNEDGKMQTGWIDNNTYYCDKSTGAMVTGWKWIEIPEEAKDLEKAYDINEYFYFEANGQAVKADTDDVARVKKIDGKRYGFDENGVMVKGWHKVKDATPLIAGYMYFAPKTENSFVEGAALCNSWYSMCGPENENNDELSTGDTEWFYFDNQGFPITGTSGIGTVKKITGKRYVFNEYGNPAYGFVKGTDGTNTYYYYCGDTKIACSAKSGKFRVSNDGEMTDFYFDAMGRGYSGVKENKLYYNGKLQKADSDLKYVAITVNDKTYAVNQLGNVIKNKKKLKDSDGNIVSTNKYGEIEQNISGYLEEIEPESPALEDD